MIKFALCDDNNQLLSKLKELLETIFFRNNLDADIVFTTDVIVGFPGETEEEFEKTYQFIEKVGFTQLHVFPYSPRRGTPAAKMDNQIADTIKHERVNRLIELSHQLNSQYAKSQIGKTLRVLFEKEEDGFFIGHGDNYLLVKVSSDDRLIGQIRDVIIESYDEILFGRVI